MKHTPGPWFVVNNGREVATEASSGAGTRQNGFRHVAITAHRDRRFSGDEQEWKANARLIAAAPEMASELAKAADTFADLRRLNTMLRKMALAEACGISEDSIRDLLAKIDGAA